jgi:hypothetical protein
MACPDLVQQGGASDSDNSDDKVVALDLSRDHAGDGRSARADRAGHVPRGTLEGQEKIIKPCGAD